VVVAEVSYAKIKLQTSLSDTYIHKNIYA